jgi:hypothetical protein
MATLDRFARPFAITITFALLTCSLTASAQVIRQRVLDVNGRTVQEIRLGNEPGSPRLVRMVVVTNGPTAGTTSLLTAVADVNDWMDPTAPAPTFTSVIPSGTVFSVGGGCTRGGHIDFPFINANEPRVLLFSGGAPTILPVSVAGSLWDSADCAVANDDSRTYFLFTNRVQQNGFFYVDTGGANDLVAPQVSLGGAKTPFAGGLRPSLSPAPDTARKVNLLFMQPNGQSRWWQYDPDAINVDFNCVAGAQAPPPTTFTIPRGARVAGRSAIADFDGDGAFEVVQMAPATPPNCTSVPTPTNAGPVAGSNFNWSEPGVALDPETGQLNFLAGTYTSLLANNQITSRPGAGGAGGGSYAACPVSSSENINQMLIAKPAPSAFQLQIEQRQINDANERAASRVILKGGFESDDFLIRAFCVLARQF